MGERNGIQVDVLFKVNSLKCKCTAVVVAHCELDSHTVPQKQTQTHEQKRSRIIETYTQITRTPAHKAKYE